MEIKGRRGGDSSASVPRPRVTWNEALLARDEAARGVLYGTMKINEPDTPFLVYDEEMAERDGIVGEIIVNPSENEAAKNNGKINMSGEEAVALESASKKRGEREMRMVGIEELQRRLGLLEKAKETGKMDASAGEARPQRANAPFKDKRKRFYAAEVKGVKFSSGITNVVRENVVSDCIRAMKTPRCAYLWDEMYCLHSSGAMDEKIPFVEPCRHWEHAATKRRIHTMLCTSGLIDKLRVLKPAEAPKDVILAVHDEAYVEKVIDASARGGGWVGEEAFVGPQGYRIALLSVGGCLAAIDCVFQNSECTRAYALVRPPGHHAVRSSGMGFCIFNNICCAAEYAKATYGVSKIAIIDYDVHHGNGTQDHFYERGDVLFLSIHQAGNYPLRSGAVDETGIGEGIHANINVPLPPGSGHGAYIEVFSKVVVPAVGAFDPDLILVSSGFDASYMDPLARMMLSSESYRSMTRSLVDLAERHCKGRIAFFHEGGYSEVYVPFCGLAVIEELSEHRTSVEDPFLEEVNSWGYQSTTLHQLEVVKKAEANVELLKCKMDAMAKKNEIVHSTTNQ